MIKTIAVFIVFAVIGGAAVLLLSPTASFALPQFTSLTQPLTGIVNQAQTTWATIPSSIQGVVMLGIPTAAALFFAWTKSRAMDKLQQTQQQAATKIGELQGETLNAVSENTTLKQTLQVKDQQIATYENAQADVAAAQQKVEAMKANNLRLQGSVTQSERMFKLKYLKPEEEPPVK